MKICRIRLSETAGLVLDKSSNKGIDTRITNECEGVRLTFSRFGRVLNHIEVGRDFTPLLSFGKELGVPQEGDFNVVTGRFGPKDLKHDSHQHESHNVYNCIVVSFGHGNEFAFYEIHRGQDPENYQLYSVIRDVSRVASREEVLD